MHSGKLSTEIGIVVRFIFRSLFHFSEILFIVSNAGLIMGCLAIAGDDTTGISSSLLQTALTNAVANCVNGENLTKRILIETYCCLVPQESGTGSETPNYWYFALTGLAELSSSLQVSTGGGDFGMLTTNPSLNLTSLFVAFSSSFSKAKFSADTTCMFME